MTYWSKYSFNSSGLGSLCGAPYCCSWRWSSRIELQTPIHSSQIYARGYSEGEEINFPTTSWLFWQNEQRRESSEPARFTIGLLVYQIYGQSDYSEVLGKVTHALRRRRQFSGAWSETSSARSSSKIIWDTRIHSSQM